MSGPNRVGRVLLNRCRGRDFGPSRQQIAENGQAALSRPNVSRLGCRADHRGRVRRHGPLGTGICPAGCPSCTSKETQPLLPGADAPPPVAVSV